MQKPFLPLEVLRLWKRLPPDLKRVGALVGVREAALASGAAGALPADGAEVALTRRFHTALALLELLNEAPLARVAAEFGCSRGLLQALQQGAATYAGTDYSRAVGNSLNLDFLRFTELLTKLYIWAASSLRHCFQQCCHLVLCCQVYFKYCFIHYIYYLVAAVDGASIFVILSFLLLEVGFTVGCCVGCGVYNGNLKKLWVKSSKWLDNYNWEKI